MFKPITRRQIFYSSKLKEFADDNFKFNKSGRNLSIWAENTAGKGEIACYKQFLLFPQYFQNASFPGASKGVTVWEWVKKGLNIEGKGENAGYQHFLLFPKCFLKGCPIGSLEIVFVWKRVK